MMATLPEFLQQHLGACDNDLETCFLCSLIEYYLFP